MRFLADENFNNRILRALQSQYPGLEIIRAQDTVIYQAPDPALLEWAAHENCVLLTHDVQTIPKYAYERIAKTLPMPGVIAVHSDTTIGQAVDELLVVIGAGKPIDFEHQVIYIPLR